MSNNKQGEEMNHIKSSIYQWLYSWEECSQCHFMVLPKMQVSNERVLMTTMPDKVICKDCKL